MSNYPTHVTLTITHPSLAPDKITRLLQLEADVKHALGERQRSAMSTEYLDKTYDHTFWAHIFFPPEGKEISLLMNDVMLELSHRAAPLQSIRQTGGNSTLFVPAKSEEERLSLQRAFDVAAEPLALDLRVEHWSHPHAHLG